MRLSKNAGFTLVEVLIVVLILTILAMAVAPKFISASNDARQSTLRSSLQTVRQQIEVYKTQHGSNAPNVNESGGADTANFVARMIGKTDSSGLINANGKCGPYLRVWPKNPYCAANISQSIEFGKSATSPMDGTTGWFFSTSTLILYGNAGVAE